MHAAVLRWSVAYRPVNSADPGMGPWSCARRMVKRTREGIGLKSACPPEVRLCVDRLVSKRVQRNLQ